MIVIMHKDFYYPVSVCGYRQIAQSTLEVLLAHEGYPKEQAHENAVALLNNDLLECGKISVLTGAAAVMMLKKLDCF